MRIDKAQIQTLIPHAGSMCLVDTVLRWDEDGIACQTRTHRDPANPLRRQGHLPPLHAVEYGAQAAAIHGGLRARGAGQTAPAGYLAAVRDARWFTADLAAVEEPLEIAARRLWGEAGHCIYAVQVMVGDRVLAQARITILPQPEIEGRS